MLLRFIYPAAVAGITPDFFRILTESEEQQLPRTPPGLQSQLNVIHRALDGWGTLELEFIRGPDKVHHLMFLVEEFDVGRLTSTVERRNLESL
ncbi:hypothetical protein STEG23_007801 [Scotinomys teguina]